MVSGLKPKFCNFYFYYKHIIFFNSSSKFENSEKGKSYVFNLNFENFLKILEYVCMKFKRSKNIKTLILLNMVFSKINGLNFNTNRMFSISQLSFQNLAFLFLYLHSTVYKYELNLISNFISSPKSNLNSSAKFLGSNSF